MTLLLQQYCLLPQKSEIFLLADNLKYFIEFGKDGCKSVLFCHESSAYDEKWEGARLGYSEAVSFLGVDEVAPLPSLGTEQ